MSENSLVLTVQDNSEIGMFGPKCRSELYSEPESRFELVGLKAELENKLTVLFGFEDSFEKAVVGKLVP